MIAPANRFAAAAIELAELGYATTPLGANRKPLLKGWPDHGPSPEETAWRFATPGVAGIAVITAAPLVVFDLDRNHADGVDGLREFQKFLDIHSPNKKGNGYGCAEEPKSGASVQTKRNGLHLWFGVPAGQEVRAGNGWLVPGVDIKAGRYCATCPPTPGYSWYAKPCPIDQLPPLPDWLAAMVARPKPTRPELAPITMFSGDLSGYGRRALLDELVAVERAPVGARNQAVNRAAFSLGQLVAGGVLPICAVEAGLLKAAEVNGHIADDGLPAVQRTIRAGLKAGSRTPRAPDPRPKN
jgi:hypothetical protein